MRFPFSFRSRNRSKAIRRTKSNRRTTLRFEQLEDRRLLATIPVTLAFDAQNADGSDGGITLREAIAYINTGVVPSGDQGRFDFANLGTNDKIVFDSTVFGDGPGLMDTITLGKDSNGNSLNFTSAQGELDITKSLTIDASALTNGLTIDASGNDPTPDSTLDDSDPYELRLMDMQGLSANFDLDGDMDGADLMKWLR